MIKYSYLSEIKDTHKDIKLDILNTIYDSLYSNEESLIDLIESHVYVIDSLVDFELVAQTLKDNKIEGIYKIGDNYLLFYFTNTTQGNLAFYVNKYVFKLAYPPSDTKEQQ